MGSDITLIRFALFFLDLLPNYIPQNIFTIRSSRASRVSVKCQWFGPSAGFDLLLSVKRTQTSRLLHFSTVFSPQFPLCSQSFFLFFCFTPSDAVRTSPLYPQPSDSSRGHGFIAQNTDLIKCKLPQLTAMFLGAGKDLQKPSPTVDTTSCRCYAIYIGRARRRSGLLARENTVKPPVAVHCRTVGG